MGKVHPSLLLTARYNHLQIKSKKTEGWMTLPHKNKFYSCMMISPSTLILSRSRDICRKTNNCSQPVQKELRPQIRCQLSTVPTVLCVYQNSVPYKTSPTPAGPVLPYLSDAWLQACLPQSRFMSTPFVAGSNQTCSANRTQRQPLDHSRKHPHLCRVPLEDRFTLLLRTGYKCTALISAWAWINLF